MATDSVKTGDHPFISLGEEVKGQEEQCNPEKLFAVAHERIISNANM
jgi:hypothetical protein